MVDLNRNKNKLAIIDNAFARAEQEDARREAEEAELRRRVQKKRIEASSACTAVA